MKFIVQVFTRITIFFYVTLLIYIGLDTAIQIFKEWPTLLANDLKGSWHLIYPIVFSVYIAAKVCMGWFIFSLLRNVLEELKNLDEPKKVDVRSSLY